MAGDHAPRQAHVDSRCRTRLHDRDGAALGLKDLYPAVVADHAIPADKDGPTGTYSHAEDQDGDALIVRGGELAIFSAAVDGAARTRRPATRPGRASPTRARTTLTRRR